MLKEVFQAEKIRYSQKHGFTQSNEKIRSEINDDKIEYLEYFLVFEEVTLITLLKLIFSLLTEQ